MENFSFTKMAQELVQTKEEGVAFEDKMLKWNTAEDVKDVVNALNDAKNVHYLKLDGNTLGVEAAEAIGKALEKRPEFRKALWKNMFTGRLKTEIPQALKALGAGLIKAGAHLTVLDLSDNAIGPNGMVGLEEFLRSPVCYSLQELYLNNCGLGIHGGRMLSEAILECHKRSTEAGTPLKLKKFVAGRNRLENEGAQEIAKIFSTLKTLEEIIMPQNSIFRAGIEVLSRAFRENVNLRVLNLNDNIITAKGAEPLTDAFACLPRLQEINFGDCLLRTNGAYLFAEALTENHLQLEIVDLSANEINSDAAMAIVSAMKNKPNLKQLNLDCNYFSEESGQNLQEAMNESLCPSALVEFEDLEGSDAGDDDEDGEESNEEGSDQDEHEDYEGEEEEDIYDENEDDYGEGHHNDTTEEADEEDEDYADYEQEKREQPMYISKPPIVSTKDPLNLTKSVTAFNLNNGVEKTEKTTSATFCLKQGPCTLEMFNALEEPKELETFKKIIDQFCGDDHLMLLVFTALKCGHLSESSEKALKLAIDLYKECIDYAVKNKEENRVLKYILIQLGLVRAEENFKSPYNQKSCRYALREALKRNAITNEHAKKMFETFLGNVKDT